MACCFGCRGAGSSTYGLSASTTTPDDMAGPGSAGASSANAPTKGARGGGGAVGSPNVASRARNGSRFPTSSTRPPWSPSRWFGCTPTASTGSRPSWKCLARSSRRWSIVFSSAIPRARPSRLAQVGRAGWLSGPLRRWQKLGASRNAVGSTDLGIEPRTGPRPALLGRRIAGDQAELRTVTFGPLEIIEAGPVEIPPHRGTGFDRAEHGARVREQEFRPHDVLTVRDAIFGHVDWTRLAPQR